MMADGGGGSGGGGVGGGGGGGGRHRCRHHGEQRSGVPTVVEDRMEAAHPSPGPGSPRLAALRGLLPKVLIGHEPVSALEKLADSWLLSCPSKSSFGEECELVVTLLYAILAVPSSGTLLLPQDIASTFFERWMEDGGKMQLSELMNFLKLEWKCGATQVLFLLCANLMPEDWGQPVLQVDVSAWTQEWLPNVAPPPWLLNVLGSREDLTEFITLLRVSALLLQGVPISQTEWEVSYLGTLTRFLCAISQYQQGDYSRSLDTLQHISYVTCERKIQAWVLHLRGLDLAKLGKPHTALMKLQDAVDRSPASLPALYNMARIFQSLGEQKAELDVLDLLVKSGRGKTEEPQVSLHFSLLALHHTPKNFMNRAQYYLSCRYFQEKKYLEAAENLKSLVDKKASYNRLHVPAPRSLLRPEDNLPTLPAYSVLLVLAAMAHVSIASHQHALGILSHWYTAAEAIGGSNFYHDCPEDRMKVVVSSAGQVLHAQTLKALGQEAEALKEFIRLEQVLWWVRGVDDGAGDSPKKWDTVMLHIKTLVYKILSEMHKARGISQSHHHYRRLAKQCLDVLQKIRHDVSGQDSYPDHLALDVIHKYFKNFLVDNLMVQ